jgi:ribosomal protein S18 acetylase RimI-like enzyme
MEAVQYGVAKPPDAEEIIGLLARVFSESEPPSVAVGLSFRDMERYLRLVAPGIVSDGLTVLARCRDTGKLAGVFLTEDFASPPDLDLSQISPKILPILSLVDTLDKQFRKDTTISAGEYLHLFLLGVDGQFAGRGIGQGLVKACLDNGRQKGYRAAVTEASGKISQHLLRKQGFVDRFSVSYREFVYEGEVVFASIQEHGSAILMSRSLIP